MFDPGDFGVESAETEIGEAIVATAFVVEIGVWPFGGLFDQCGFQHLLHCSVESARSHGYGAVGEGFDLLHDCVSVLVAGGEGEQDVHLRDG